jgi:hypothetical protein
VKPADLKGTCENLCTGAFSHGRPLAEKYGIDLAEVDEEHQHVHALVAKRLTLPGGAVQLVMQKQAIESQVLDSVSAIARMESKGFKDDNPSLAERRAMLDNAKRSLAAVEATLDTLPAESKVEPQRAVSEAIEEMSRIRATGNGPAIGAQAKEIDRRRAFHASAMEAHAKNTVQVQKAAAVARALLARALGKAVAVVQKRAGALTSAPEYEHAPELMDMKALGACWREAVTLSEAVAMLHTNIATPNAWDLFEHIPVAVWDAVGAGIGLGTVPRRAREMLMLQRGGGEGLSERAIADM